MVRTGPGRFVRLQAIVILCEFFGIFPQRPLFPPKTLSHVFPRVFPTCHLAFSSNFDDFGSQKFCAAISQHGATKPSKDTVQPKVERVEEKG